MPHPTSSSLQDFYTLHAWQQEGEAIACEATFNAAHDIFQGHFPGQPVVPGVCTMAMVKEIAERATGEDLRIQSTGQVKFLRLLTPEVSPVISVVIKKDEAGALSVSSTWKVDGADVFKMTAILQANGR